MAPTTNGVALNGATHTTAGATNDEDEKSFRNRYAYARYADSMKNELIEDILTQYEHLVKTHQKYVEAHQQEREAAQAAMGRVEGIQSSIDYLQRLLNRDPFILVLIDGNDLIFHHNFLKQGETGGKAAASTVNSAILDWARTSIPEIPEDTKVIVHVYANVKVIAEACAKAGLVDHPCRVEEFARGFALTPPLNDFTDVRAPRNTARGKIGESLKLYLYNYYCRHILLGCNHDAYTSALHPYMHDTQAKARITLLEGPPPGQDLAALPLSTKKFPGIFHDTLFMLQGPFDSYPDPRTRVGSNVSLNAASTDFTPRTNTPANLSSPFGSVTSLDQHATLARPHVRVDSMDESRSDGGGTWAVVTSKNAHKPIKDSVTSPVPRGPAPVVHRNKKGQRIDLAMDYDRNEVQRIKKLKSCNQHYIGVGCCHYNAGKADKCPHNHHFNFTPSELKALRVVARETPCKKGHECDDPKCIYGHQCPFPVAVEGSMRGSGLCLNGESCRFPSSMHGMDTAAMRVTKITGN